VFVGILNLLVGAVAAMTVSGRLSIPVALLLTLLLVGGAYVAMERREPFSIQKKGIAGDGV
jgi:hypothetical protein